VHLERAAGGDKTLQFRLNQGLLLVLRHACLEDLSRRDEETVVAKLEGNIVVGSEVGNRQHINFLVGR
jgi:hypothetical protein